MLDACEPPNGVSVAFVARIRRRQPARPMQRRELRHSGAGVASSGGPGPRADAVARSDAPSQRRPVAAAAPAAARSPAGARIGAATGAALLAFGLIAEGGIFLARDGATLLWRCLRRPRRAAAAAASPAQQVEHAFGHGRPKFCHRGHR
jgi:hypothetical protein